jgi:oligopeptidase B
MPVPPVAPRQEHFETWHDVRVADPYHWLREKTNPEVIRYLEAENAYTAAITAPLKPFEDVLYEEMLGRIKQTDLSVPVRRGGFLYYSRTEEGKQYPIFYRRPNPETEEQVLLDVNQLAEGHAFMSIGTFVVSDDANLLAYSTDSTGFRQYQLHIKDLRSGEIFADTAERVTSIEWAADNRTLFLTTEDAQTKRSDRVFRHVLGSTEYEPVFEEPDELYRVLLHRTRDRRFLLIEVRSTDATEVRYLPSATPESPFTMVLPRENKHKYDVDHRDGLFYIRTNRDAKNYRIVTGPVSDPDPRNWTTLVPHDPEVLIEGIDLFQSHAVLLEKYRALNRMKILDFGTGEWHEIPFPEPVYSAFPTGNPEFDTRVYRYSYQSLVTPSSVFDYDIEKRQATLLKQQEVLGGYDPSRYASERLWATARDGLKIPLSVVYPKDFPRDGTGPLFLYAYGSYGIGMAASFSSVRLSLLERGMAFAIAHIRGGDDLGEAWHDDGMLMKKKNTFFDFIDSAEFLIREKWTSADRLIIQGGSAGGLLMGAVVNLRPDLFRAVHAAVPFVDVINTMMDASLPLTVGEYLEWGDPHQKEAFEYMRSYSPYDNLEPRAYPAMLVTTGVNDSQVMYWEPAKYVARLRTVKTDAIPLLLKTNMGAGHGGASGRYDRLKEQAFEYSWLLAQLGLAISVRPMELADWGAIREIYLEGIATGNATLETSAPEWEQWNRSHRTTCRFVAELDGELAGWAALSPVSSRAVYSGVAEVSVYTGERYRGKKVGRTLLSALVAASER